MKTTHPKISKYYKLAKKKYKNRHEWLGKVIHQELFKGLNFDPNDKRYMLKPESLLRNQMYKILWDFEIQMDPPITARISDLVIITKKKRSCHQVNFTISVDHRVKIKESEMIYKYLDLAREQKKVRKMKVKVISTVVGTLGMIPKGLVKRLWKLKIRGRSVHC